MASKKGKKNLKKYDGIIGRRADGEAVTRPFRGRTVAEAKQQYHTYLTEHGIDAERKICDDEFLVRGWARRWLLDYKKPAVSTKAYYTTYEDPVYKYILPEFGDLPLFAVTSERVGAFYDRISGVLSPSMCSKVSMCLNAIFETAIYNDLCDKNPAKFKKLKSKKRVKRKPVYSDAEILTAERWFLNKMPEVVLLLETGARRGEMAGWCSGDFDLRLRAYDISRQLQRQKGGVIVERAPKNDSFRTNPLSNVAIQAYKRCLEMYGPGPYLVHEHGAALNPEKWSARLKREMERFNRAYPSIPPLTSHQLRHTYGTWLRRHGVDIHSIAKILGHKSIDVTGNTYVHNELATLRRAIRFNAKQPLIIPIREEQTA